MVIANSEEHRLKSLEGASKKRKNSKKHTRDGSQKVLCTTSKILIQLDHLSLGDMEKLPSFVIMSH